MSNELGLNLEIESSQNVSCLNDLCQLLHLKGKILVNEIYQLDRLCNKEKIAIIKKIDKEKNNIDYKITFKVDNNFIILFDMKTNIEDEYIDNEYTVNLNGISKYRGYNLVPAINEIITCIKEGVDKRESYEKTPEYKCSLFKIKYLYAFKKFLESGEVDKSRLEFLLKNMVNQRSFITDSFIRNIYSIGKVVFCIDTYNNDSYKMRIYSGNDSFECSSKDLIDCIRKLYSVVYPLQDR